jgi:hypothetical protein
LPLASGAGQFDQKNFSARDPGRTVRRSWKRRRKRSGEAWFDRFDKLTAGKLITLSNVERESNKNTEFPRIGSGAGLSSPE